jgi:hypothetical protein
MTGSGSRRPWWIGVLPGGIGPIRPHGESRPPMDTVVRRSTSRSPSIFANYCHIYGTEMNTASTSPDVKSASPIIGPERRDRRPPKQHAPIYPTSTSRKSTFLKVIKGKIPMTTKLAHFISNSSRLANGTRAQRKTPSSHRDYAESLNRCVTLHSLFPNRQMSATGTRVNHREIPHLISAVCRPVFRGNLPDDRLLG